MNIKNVFSLIDYFYKEDQQAFEQTKEKLYKLLGFKVLSFSDVRPCDLKEKLSLYYKNHEEIGEFGDSFRVQCSNFPKWMIGLLIKYIQPDERNKAYLDKALLSYQNYMKNANPDDIETLFVIFVSMFRNRVLLVKEDEKWSKCLQIGDVNYFLNREDIEFISSLLLNDKVLHFSDIEKPKKSKSGISYVEGSIDKFKKQCIYIYCVILFYGVLQMEGDLN